jgi:excisionase family DNA binding protein
VTVEMLNTLVDSWLTYRDTADRLGVSANKVRQLVREHQLAAVRLHGVGEPCVPELFLAGLAPVKGLSGTLVLLSDRGFDDAEAIEWLFTADDTLPGRPIDLLRDDRGKEVHRRAQALL